MAIYREWVRKDESNGIDTDGIERKEASRNHELGALKDQWVQEVSLIKTGTTVDTGD